MAIVIVPLLTPSVAPHQAPVPRIVSTIPVDVPVSRASSSTCAAAAALKPTLSHDAAPVAQRMPLSPSSPATLARDKILQQSRSQQPSVSTPIDVDVLEHELSSHLDRNFVNCVLNSFRFGTRIGYTGPHLPRVLPQSHLCLSTSTRR